MKTDKQLIDEYKRLLQLQFPEDAADLIFACEDEILRRMERHLHSAAQPGWISTADALPKDDSDVFAAIWWINKDNPAYSHYSINDCTYHEDCYGKQGAERSIFVDCEGEEFEAADVAYWIYKKDLAAQFKPPVAAQPEPGK
jgi:hypothetical protein